MDTGLTEKQQGQWRMAAGFAPIILLGSRCGWLGILSVLGLWGLLLLLPAERDETERSGILRILIMGLTAGETLRAVGASWPGPEKQWIPLILGALALWAALRGKDPAAQGSILLLWPTGILMGAVLLSGLGEIQMENLELSGIQREPLLEILTVCLILGIGRSVINQKRRTLWGKLLLLGLISAIVAQGVLTAKLQAADPNPFYLLGRSVDLLGKMKRMESLIILGMLLGIYLWMAYLMGMAGERGYGKAAAAAVGTVLYLTKFQLPKLVLPALIILSEYLYPVIRNKLRNQRKNFRIGY